MANVSFTNAVRKVFRIDLTFSGTPEEVFPQLCPVAEYDWIAEWAGAMVYSDSGVAELGCVFRSEGHGGVETWTVSRYEPPTAIEFVRVLADEQVTKLDLALAPPEPGSEENRTPATMTITMTALSEAAAARIAGMTDEPLVLWKELERKLNHYLTTGTMLLPSV
jgi:hypothetical protein